MSTRVVIAGAGGFGREIHAWLNGSPRFMEVESITDIVYIDDAQPEVPVPAPIICTLAAYVPAPGDALLCAIGIPSIRRAVVESLRERGARFLTFRDDRAIVGANVTMGEGCVVCPGAVITTNVELGLHVHVNINCSIGHDARIGDYTTLSPACNLMGGVTAESEVFFGTAATVIPRKSIGEKSIVGAGSVVVKNVPPNVTTFGNPSVIIRKGE